MLETNYNLQLKRILEHLESIIDLIPIRHNLVSHLMFLGIAQAYFLALVIFIRSKANSPIRIFGWSLLFQSIVCTDIYLCYTGLMKYTLQWNDSTEFLVLLIAPSIYFFTNALLERQPFNIKKYWPHLLVPLIYPITQAGYFLNPLSVKLNAYLDAYHPSIPLIQVPENTTYHYQIIKGEFRWLVLLSFAFYLGLSIRLVLKSGKNRKKSTRQIRVDKYAFTRNTIIFLVFLLTLIFAVYLNFEDDAGDHFIVLSITTITYVSSFFILSESRFFENSWLADRYETLTANPLNIERIESAILEDYYFLSPEVSLKRLSERLEVNSNIVSKTINSELQLNFNDYINQKRVKVAQERLLSREFTHLTVEAIGNSVGFNSKSAFYTAFKKFVGSSPSAFVKQNKALK
ncbi:MAG: AraC family transcriptional regulator [Bacteroidota bacterium]